MSTYPSWTPTSEAEIQRMIDGGLIEEGHHFDAKRLFSPGKGANKEMARDLASLAVDGGVLAVGIDEPDAGTFTLSPQPHAGQPERIEQVAATSVDPPLYVQTSVITAEDNADTGYIWIHVPPSGQGPHQVDGTYFGRGDKTKIRLSDAEVARLVVSRSAQEARIETLLDAEVTRDPVRVPSFRTRYGHGFLVAEPLVSNDRRAEAFIRTEEARSWVRTTSRDTSLVPIDHSDGASDLSLSDFRSVERRGQSLAYTTEQLAGTGRRYSLERVTDERPCMDVEFTMSGGVRFFFSPVAGPIGPREVPLINDRVAVKYVRRLLAWTSAFSQKHGYRGSWLLGVHLEQLDGRPSREHGDPDFLTETPTLYDRSTYRETDTASTQEIEEMPWAVAERLVGRLTWTLGTRDQYAHLLDAPESE